MHRMRVNWRLLAPVVALVAVAALLLGGTLTEQDQASAGAPVEVSSGVSCADLLLVELTNPKLGDPNPIAIDEPVPANVVDTVFGLIPRGLVATSLTYSKLYDNGDSDSAGVTVNFGLPGIISGVVRTAEPCASVDKAVATVTSAPSDPGKGPATLSVTETPGNGPLVDMLVYWNSTNTSQQGFWIVTSTGAGSVTVRATDAFCNDPPVATSAPGTLHSCVPNSKPVEVYAYTNPDVSKGGYLDPGAEPRAEPGADENCTGPFTHVPYGPGGVPLTTCGVGYDNVHNVSYSVTCAPTASLENPPASSWTRTEVYSKSSGSDSRKVPGFGVVQLFNPVAPNTCVNTAETKRSTNAIVGWELDSSDVEGDRANWDSDWDGDGCMDWQELDFPQPTYQNDTPGSFLGGRDPTNPYDCGRNLTGVWSITATVADAALKVPAKTINPGAYYRCRAYFDHDKITNDIGGPVFCYIDIPGIPVNPEAGPESGDGLPGDPYPIGTGNVGPPEPYADVDDVQSELNGSYDPGTDTITMSGCFEDRDGQSPLGNVYVEASAVVLSGHGSVEIWAGESTANCLAGTPAGTSLPANLQIGIQAGKEGGPVLDTQYDFDLDRCPDKNELSNDQSHGGLRDPFNPWDYFNPTHDGLNRVDDILKVVGQYFIDAGNPSYTTDTDRTAVIGANPWNLSKPNGQQRVDDILAAVKSYFHDCSIPH